MKHLIRKAPIICPFIFLFIIVTACEKEPTLYNPRYNGLLLREKYENEKLVERYSYNDKNQVIKTEEFLDGVVFSTRIYSYYSNGNLKEMKQGDNYVLKLEYSSDYGTITLKEYIDNTLKTTYHYDSSNYIKTLSGFVDNNTPFVMKAYYNQEGNITKHTYSESGKILWTTFWENYDNSISVPVIFKEVYSLLENTKNNPLSYSFEDDQNIFYSENYTYTYHDKKYPTNIEIKSPFYEFTETIKLTYVYPK